MTKITFETDKHLEIEGVRLKRGELATKRIRTLELADGSVVELPLIVVRGASPGPVLYLGAAFHGDEINGVEIAFRLAREVEIQKLRGTILVVPVQNPMAFQVQHRYFIGHLIKSPLDQSPADPWVSLPGDKNGNIASRIAHTLFQNLMQHSDYMIDIHTPTTGGRYAPFAFLPPTRCGVIVEQSEALAKAFGADFILATNEGVYVQDTNPHTVMAHRGKVALGLELGEGGRIEPDMVERGLQGLYNVLRHVGMLAGAVESFGRRMVITSMPVIRATRGGLHHRHVELNQDLEEGQLVSTIIDVFGQVAEEIRAPLAGPVVRVSTFPLVSEGERVCQLGIERM
jgi:hypothetical protein